MLNEEASYQPIDHNIVIDHDPELDDTLLSGCQHGCCCVKSVTQDDSCCCCRSYLKECSANCSCDKSACTNRQSQESRCQLCLVTLGVKGFGVVTDHVIEKGQFVCEYLGEVISTTEAKKRFKTRRNERHNYILVFHEHFSSGQITTVVDARHFGSLARFINHSCDPNLEVRPVRSDCMRPRICFFANRNIEIGEELTYSYGDGISSSDKHCLCGSRICKGFLPSDSIDLD